MKRSEPQPTTALNINFLATALAAEIGAILSLPTSADPKGRAATVELLKSSLTLALGAKLKAEPPESIDARLALEIDTFAEVRVSVIEQARLHLATMVDIAPPTASEVN